jgi:hypothetical protein
VISLNGLADRTAEPTPNSGLGEGGEGFFRSDRALCVRVQSATDRSSTGPTAVLAAEYASQCVPNRLIHKMQPLRCGTVGLEMRPLMVGGWHFNAINVTGVVPFEPSA